jgi:hypothetical protein
VDLAACDRHHNSSIDTKSQWRFKEGQLVNRSLSCLHEVLGAVYTPQAVDVSWSSKGDTVAATKPRYRSCTLTYMLQEFLQPEAKLAFVVHADPNPMHVDDTMTALKFASVLR